MESTDSSSGSQQPQLPPGFRFHPTDEELVVHYLKRKAAAAPLPVAIIAEVDLYKFDPWELPERAIFGEQEWYFFTPRDRKYPNGARPNRAATSGYWKATGTDKPVLTAGGTQKVGVKKALVFYRGKPPKGIKTNWIMHEYRLITDNKSNISKPPAGCDFAYKKGSLSLRLDDWVLCRIYKKNSSAQRPVVDQDLNDVIMPADASTISIPVDQNINMYENMMMSDHHEDAMMMKSSTDHHRHHHDHQNLHMMAQRMLPNLYWNDDDERNNPTANSPNAAAKISYLSSENNSMTTTTTNNNSMANNNILMSHQTPSLQQQEEEEQAMLGNIGDRVFEQQAYQVSGMNWYT